jgi:hypothetical protein
MKIKPLRFLKPQRFNPHAQKKHLGCPEDNISITGSLTCGNGNANQPLPGGQDKNSE